MFGKDYLFEIIFQMIEKYKAERLQEGVGPVTINKKAGCLRHMYNKAIEWGFGKRNPVKGLKMLKEPLGRVRYLEKDEIERLLKTIESLPKTNETRTIPINETFYRELKKISQKSESEYVFCDKKGNNYEDIRKGSKRALKIAGINDFRFHNLRHTFASQLVMKGCDIRIVQQLMGHKQINRDAVGRLNSLMGTKRVNRSLRIKGIS